MHGVVTVEEKLPVLVAVDGSRNGLSIVDLGVMEALRHRSPLSIVHVWPGQYVGPFRGRGPVSGPEDGRRLLDLAARRAEHLAPGLEVVTDLAQGSAFGTITERSGTARMLVVGHRDGVLTRPSWGSTTAYLAHHSACPLLVHRGVAPSGGPVGVAVSLRSDVTASVDVAAEEASLRGVRLVAVHAWPPPDDATAATSRIPPPALRDAEERLSAALAPATASHPELLVEQVVVSGGDVDYTIQRAGRRCQLLVAGMGATSRVAELLYGGRLDQSLRRQPPCPVLLVPPAWRPARGSVTATAVDGKDAG
ncbi:universal stress protein [Actinoplanes sp. NPDC089786]|uniref:universal stress protein n=1 Tax=Actinoplanes sp. NPDC089786 TaxID=3155185 RepID=UPI0034463908